MTIHIELCIIEKVGMVKIDEIAFDGLLTRNSGRFHEAFLS
jgi:hypothetical protein